LLLAILVFGSQCTISVRAVDGIWNGTRRKKKGKKRRGKKKKEKKSGRKKKQKKDDMRVVIFNGEDSDKVLETVTIATN
jgi:ribosomal protein S25